MLFSHKVIGKRGKKRTEAESIEHSLMKNMQTSQTNLNSRPKNGCGEKNERPKKCMQGNLGPKKCAWGNYDSEK